MKLWLLVGCVCFFLVVHAQQNPSQQGTPPNIDALTKQLDDAKGVQRASLLSQLARIVFPQKPDQAFAYTQEALSIYKAENDEKGQIEVMQALASLHRRKNEHAMAGQLDSMSLVMARKINYGEGIAAGLNNLILKHIRLLDYDKALALANEAIAIKKAASPDRLLAILYIGRANIYLQKNRADEAGADYQKAYAISKAIKIQPLMEGALNGLSRVARVKGDVAGSLDNLINAIKVAEKNNDKEQLASLYMSLGNAYGSIDPKLSIEYYKKAWVLQQQWTTRQPNTSLLGNIGNYYYRGKVYDSALYYHALRAEMARKIKDTAGVAFANLDMGDIALEKGDASKAITFYENALVTFAGRKRPSELVGVYNSLASAYLKTKRYDKAEAYLLKSYDLSPKVEKGRQRYTNFLLSQVYEETGEMDKARQFRNEYLAMSDSTVTAETKLKMSRLQSEYEIGKREDALVLAAQEQRLKDLELKEAKTKLWGSIVAIALLAGIAGIVYKNYRAKKKAALLLEQKNDRIETLLHELHHRVKNNLQVIGSVLNLQSARLTDQQAKSAIEEGKTRLEAMSLLHQKMYLDDNLRGINIEEYIGSLTDMLTSSFGYSRSVVETHIDVPSQQLDVDLATPLALIINELITNAFKHAFQQVEKPLLKINLTEDAAGRELMLKVSDNGKGINLASVSPNSFGLKLIRTFVKQLNATMSISNDHGTEFNIAFKYV